MKRARGVVYVALVMLVLAQALLYAARVVWPDPGPKAVVLLHCLLPLPLAIALGGAVAVRRLDIRWAELVVAALLGAGLAALIGLVVPALRPGDPGAGPEVPGALLLTVAGAAGVFALALLDRAVRRSGVLPSRRKLAVAAAAFVALLLAMDLGMGLGRSGHDFGAVVAMFGLLAGLFLVALGLAFTLARRPSLGANAGGLGALVLAGTYLVWAISIMIW